jgi:hypothetical protein
MSLAYTGLVGWWGFFGAFYWAPRATYENWRAVWRPPGNPLKWGAVPVAAVAAALAEERAARKHDVWSGFDVDLAALAASLLVRAGGVAVAIAAVTSPPARYSPETLARRPSSTRRN